MHYMATMLSTASNNNNNNDDKMKNSETDLCRIQRILCMPGTRTLLLMANKQDVLDDDHHNKEGDISDDQEMFDDNDVDSTTAVDTFNELKSSSPLSTSMTINSMLGHNPQELIGSNSQSSNGIIMTNKATRCHSSKGESNRFLSNDDRFVCEEKFLECLRTKMNDGVNYKSIIGLEQQIYGAITFYKSYRLESLKVLEIALIAVKIGHERLGIGTQLIKVI